MKLTILGSGTCAVTNERSCSCYLLQTDSINVKSACATQFSGDIEIAKDFAAFII
ncbi:hypothetical protein JW998_10095 [candidate division KSB1 bacterium]|nr:hypothetical protein [candidate division KSB1 bacterium]